MSKVFDRTNIRYGKLTAIKVHEVVKKKGAFWLCKCDCGNEIIVRGNVLGKNTNSCGCIKKEQDKQNLGRFVNGKMKSRLASIWYHMKSRCYNEKDTNYKNYGCRGIKICDEWLENFELFEKWSLVNGYKDNLTLDRIDVNGDYEPSNCRWVNQETQSNNKRNTLFVEYKGEIISLKQAYKILKPNISYQTSKTRYHKGIRDIGLLFSDARQHRGN